MRERRAVESSFYSLTHSLTFRHNQGRSPHLLVRRRRSHRIAQHIAFSRLPLRTICHSHSTAQSFPKY